MCSLCGEVGKLFRGICGDKAEQFINERKLLSEIYPSAQFPSQNYFLPLADFSTDSCDSGQPIS
jgi:hypothetical protein